MRVLGLAGLIALLAAVGAVGYWAGRVAFDRSEDLIQNQEEPVVYVVETGSVSRSLSFTAVANWPLEPAGRYAGSGVVTSVEVLAGSRVSAGQVLYSVDLRPVVVAEGAVPMFRSLDLRDEGADVAQLQEMLATLGFYDGEVDGDFGTSTRRAVRDWQESLGIEDTGVVGPGDLIFVESLPSRVALSESVTRGARISDGEVVVSSVHANPVFSIPISPEQADLVSLSANVRIAYSSGIWEAQVDRAVETDQGQLDLLLSNPSGGPVCRYDCLDWVSLEGSTNFRAEVVVVPKTTGPVVPVGALRSDAANQPAVTLADGTLVPVTILQSANGMAVVDGIDPGTEIVLFEG